MVAVVVDSAAAAALPLHPPASPCAGGRAYRAIVVTLLTATLLTLAMLSQTGGRNCQQLHSTPGAPATLRLLPAARQPELSPRLTAHQPHQPPTHFPTPRRHPRDGEQHPRGVGAL